jgi:hypothetical protein
LDHFAISPIPLPLLRRLNALDQSPIYGCREILSSCACAEIQRPFFSTSKPHQVASHGYYYAYPAGSGNQVYVGQQKQYNTYKQLLQAQRAQMAQASAAESAQPTFTEETAGPNHIVVQEFDGFGPLGIDTGGF